VERASQSIARSSLDWLRWKAYFALALTLFCYVGYRAVDVDDLLVILVAGLATNAYWKAVSYPYFARPAARQRARERAEIWFLINALSLGAVAALLAAFVSRHWPL